MATLPVAFSSFTWIEVLANLFSSSQMSLVFSTGGTDPAPFLFLTFLFPASSDERCFRLALRNSRLSPIITDSEPNPSQQTLYRILPKNWSVEVWWQSANGMKFRRILIVVIPTPKTLICVKGSEKTGFFNWKTSWLYLSNLVGNLILNK